MLLSCPACAHATMRYGPFKTATALYCIGNSTMTKLNNLRTALTHPNSMRYNIPAYLNEHIPWISTTTLKDVKHGPPPYGISVTSVYVYIPHTKHAWKLPEGSYFHTSLVLHHSVGASTHHLIGFPHDLPYTELLRNKLREFGKTVAAGGQWQKVPHTLIPPDRSKEDLATAEGTLDPRILMIIKQDVLALKEKISAEQDEDIIADLELEVQKLLDFVQAISHPPVVGYRPPPMFGATHQFVHPYSTPTHPRDSHLLSDSRVQYMMFKEYLNLQTKLRDHEKELNGVYDDTAMELEQEIDYFRHLMARGLQWQPSINLFRTK